MRAENEGRVVLAILKSPERDYNANSISKVLGITPMGALKLLKRLEKEGILEPRKVSNIIFYRLNSRNPYALDYASFMLRREAEHSPAYVKRWVSELRKIKRAEVAVLFGSVLRSGAKARDIDALFVLRGGIGAVQKEIDKVNAVNDRKIHPLFQSRADLAGNIQRRDPAILNAVKGVVAFGEKEFASLLGGAP